MKKLVLASAAFMALTVGAVAADLPRRTLAPAPVVAAPVFTWTGFYVGLNAGAAWDDSRLTLTPNAAAFAHPDLTAADFAFLSERMGSGDAGFTGGAQIGYNAQFGAFVLGAEADINGVDLDRHQRRARAFPDAFDAGDAGAIRALIGTPLIYTTNLRSDVDWFGTARIRAGFAVDRALFYVTGGFAFGEVKTSAVASATPAGGFVFNYSGSKSDTRTGWTLGGGAEYAFTSNLTLKAEYLYVDLGDDSFNILATAGAAATFPGSTFTVKDDTRFHVGRLGVNWKF